MEQEWRAELLHLRLGKSWLAGKRSNGNTDYVRSGGNKIGQSAKRGDGENERCLLFFSIWLASGERIGGFLPLTGERIDLDG